MDEGIITREKATPTVTEMFHQRIKMTSLMFICSDLSQTEALLTVRVGASGFSFSLLSLFISQRMSQYSFPCRRSLLISVSEISSKTPLQGWQMEHCSAHRKKKKKKNGSVFYKRNGAFKLVHYKFSELPRITRTLQRKKG